MQLLDFSLFGNLIHASHCRAGQGLSPVRTCARRAHQKAPRGIIPLGAEYSGGDGGSRTHAPLRTYRISSATSYDHLSTSPDLLLHWQDKIYYIPWQVTGQEKFLNSVIHFKCLILSLRILFESIIVKTQGQRARLLQLAVRKAGQRNVRIFNMDGARAYQ